MPELSDHCSSLADGFSEAYRRQFEDFFAEGDQTIVRQIFLSQEPLVLRNAATIARQIATKDPALAVQLICTADFDASPEATHEFLMWLSHRDTIPLEVVTDEQWEALLQKLGRLRKWDEHWVDAFLKKAVAAHPAKVIEMLKARLLENARSFDFQVLRRSRKGSGLALLSHPDGLQLLRELLTWAVNQQVNGNLRIDTGRAVAGLCGKYGPSLLELLLGMLAGGTQADVDVVASVLRSAHQTFLLEEASFVRQALDQAEILGEEAVESALIGAVVDNCERRTKRSHWRAVQGRPGFEGPL